MNSTTLMEKFTELFCPTHKVTLTEKELTYMGELNLYKFISNTLLFSPVKGDRVYECQLELGPDYCLEDFSDDISFIVSQLEIDSISRDIQSKFILFVITGDNPLFANVDPSQIAYMQNDTLLKIVNKVSFEDLDG